MLLASVLAAAFGLFLIPSGSLLFGKALPKHEYAPITLNVSGKIGTVNGAVAD